MQPSPQISKEDYRSIFCNSPATKLIIDTDAPVYTILDVNDAYLFATNSDRESLVGHSVFGVFPPNPTDMVSKNIERTIFSFNEAIQSKMPHTMYNYRYDIPIRGTDEFEERYWTTSNTPVLDDEGNVKFLIHSPVNVTETVKLAQREQEGAQALKDQQKQLHSVFMQAPVGIGIFKGADYVVDLINPPLCELYGRTFKELIGKPIFDVLTSARGQGFEQILDNVRSTGVPFVGRAIPLPLNRKGKEEIIYVNFVYEPFKEVDGRISGVIAVATEITDQIESKLKLQESEEQFRFMSESMPQQVWTSDASGKLNYVNEWTQKYFGRTSEDLLEAGIERFIHPDDLNRCMSKWAEALTTGEIFQVEFRMLRQDQQYRWHLSRALPFKANDTIVKWLGTNTDIEEHKKIEQKKDEFISIASHELKTPLTSLKAYLQLLERSPTATSIPSNFIKNSLSQMRRLEKLVEDLLDVSKISGGKMAYNLSVFSMNDLIVDAVGSVQQITSSHELIVERNEQAMFNGDHYRIEQVVINFLTNAIKYSPQGKKVIINSQVAEGNIVVSVQDFGIGIAKEHQQKLFERFYRVDNTAMKYDGLGLGLYVASEILQRHNGKFWIESEQDKGSTFFFSLPLQEN
jgi:PAS domain S-box-containing protein